MVVVPNQPRNFWIFHQMPWNKPSNYWDITIVGNLHFPSMKQPFVLWWNCGFTELSWLLGGELAIKSRSKNEGCFHSYVNLYQRVMSIKCSVVILDIRPAFSTENENWPQELDLRLSERAIWSYGCSYFPTLNEERLGTTKSFPTTLLVGRYFRANVGPLTSPFHSFLFTNHPMNIP